VAWKQRWGNCNGRSKWLCAKHWCIGEAGQLRRNRRSTKQLPNKGNWGNMSAFESAQPPEYCHRKQSGPLAGADSQNPIPTIAY
jgi:hypothetical protein